MGKKHYFITVNTEREGEKRKVEGDSAIVVYLTTLSVAQTFYVEW
jgi:hypothetical protein